MTLDANLLHEYWKERPKRDHVERLLELAKAGAVELAVTARIREDIPADPLATELQERLADLGIEEVGSVTRLNYWVLGRDYLASDEFLAVQNEADELLCHRSHPVPDWRDWDHVHAHFLQRRDVFLTWDKRLLDVADLLDKRLSVRVMAPDDYLAQTRTIRRGRLR